MAKDKQDKAKPVAVVGSKATGKYLKVGKAHIRVTKPKGGKGE